MFIALSLAHGAVLLLLLRLPTTTPALVASALVIGLGVWWNSNTIAHNFIHKPFFRGRALNLLFGLYQSALLGVPQTAWRQRHLAHHADRPWKPRVTPPVAAEAALVLCVWATLAAEHARFLLLAYAPGYALGLALCALHGYFEHARGTTSHYGRLYNFLFFNDGYHVEHHARPGEHWRALPQSRVAAPQVASPWPAVLRWLDRPAGGRWRAAALEPLERLALKSPRLQRFLLDRHERAFRTLLCDLNPDAAPTVGIIGGGLFPRTLLALRRVLPAAKFTLIDCSRQNLSAAADLLGEAARDVRLLNEWYEPGRHHAGYDVLVAPLALVGDRAVLYDRPPAPVVLVHDWAWRRRGVAGALVSPLLLKRINRVERGKAQLGPARRLHAPLVLSLLAVFLLAKTCTLAGHSLPASPWTPVAYLWQDVLVATAFGCTLWLLRSRWLAWALYATLVAYAAVNVPVARELSTPLTWPMLRATRGTLSGSIAHHATWLNVLLLAGVLVAGMLLPLLMRRVRLPRRAGLRAAGVLASLGVIALGPQATDRVDTLGLHRNAVAAVVATGVPRVGAGEGEAAPARPADFRASPLTAAHDASNPLSRLRGAAAGRNVVLVVLESTGAGYLRPYGAAEDPMPNLTRLCERGAVFENFYVVYPESIKSLMAGLCSTYPAFDTTPEQYERITTPSLAAVLSERGYRTGLFHSGRFEYLGMESIVRGRGFHALEDAGEIGGNQESSFGVDEPSAVARALQWVDAGRAGEPFFLAYLPIAGHHPYDSPEGGPFSEETEVGRYRNALKYADDAVGQLVDGLKQRGLFDNTLVVVYGDHGEAFGQHEGNFGHTLFLYEENVRTPLVIAGAGLFPGQVRVPGVASLVDVAPTVLDLLGVAAPAEYQGRSLLSGAPGMALFFTDYSLPLLGLRDGNWKCVHRLGSDRSKLYDLASDPQERHDLSSAHPDRVRAYRDHLKRWATSQRGRIIGSP